ncbi:hypothetical protein D3C80_1794680 [compost metagenome]
MIASELASALLTTGNPSISLGKLRAACETLSRTSFAASSRSLLRLNSTVILLDPWLLDEEIVRIPSILLIAFSSGSVI